jgi:phosphonate transport system substrate-binding protein
MTGKSTAIKRRAFVALVCLLAILCPSSTFVCPGAPAASDQKNRLRIVFTSAMVAEMNPQDAAVAVQLFGEQLVKQRRLNLDPRVSICNSLDELQRLIKSGEVDVVSLRTDEYLRLDASAQFPLGFVGMKNENWFEQYVLLTQNSNGLNTLADLRGKRLVSLSGRRTGLADEWLNNLLGESNLPMARGFFGQMRTTHKISGAVLPVFFKQMDACLVTQSGFETMSQLNPQLGKQMSAIKVSPTVLPSLICLRRDLVPSLLEDIRKTILELHQEVSGKQVLMLFALDRLILLSPTHLAGAIEIYNKYQRSIPKAATIQTPN